MVTDDYNMETFVGVVLAQEGANGVDDDTVFVVGRVEYKKGVLAWVAQGSNLSLQIG